LNNIDKLDSIRKFVLCKQYTTLYTIMVMDSTKYIALTFAFDIKTGVRLVACLSGNALVSINVVTLHLARLIFVGG